MNSRILAVWVALVCTLATGVRIASAAGPATAPTTAPATRPQPIEAKTRALAEKWKAEFAAEKFTALEAGPFLVAGNGTRQQLEAYRDGTILASAEALRAMYFKKPIDEPVLILLFESASPYKRLSKKWFDEENVPHFGFYLHSSRAMLMNVGTGTGTLVHELVHALIAPDFPDVPDWFNEGIASLYEQCQIARDRRTITGLVNWRLPPLQQAIKDDKLRPLTEMMADDDFRNAERTGMNYAHARYLMLYLQEKKLLQKYYVAFKAGHKDDPTGVKSLKAVIGPQTLEAFEKEWRAWVAGLKAGG